MPFHNPLWVCPTDNAKYLSTGMHSPWENEIYHIFMWCMKKYKPVSLAALYLLRLYGDESELHFWTIAAHYLHSLCQEKPAKPDTAVLQEQLGNPLDICYDVLCENSYFQVCQRVQNQISRNVISTVNTQFPVHISLLLVTYQSELKHSSYLKIEAGQKTGKICKYLLKAWFYFLW